MKTNALTVEFDEPTAASLEHLCQKWGVQPVEAVQRAVKQADDTPPRRTPEERLAAWREWQRVAQMTPEKAAARWAAVLDARR